MSLGAAILRKHLDDVPLWRGDYVIAALWVAEMVNISPESAALVVKPDVAGEQLDIEVSPDTPARTSDRSEARRFHGAGDAGHHAGGARREPDRRRSGRTPLRARGCECQGHAEDLYVPNYQTVGAIFARWLSIKITATATFLETC